MATSNVTIKKTAPKAEPAPAPVAEDKPVAKKPTAVAHVTTYAVRLGNKCERYMLGERLFLANTDYHVNR